MSCRRPVALALAAAAGLAHPAYGEDAYTTRIEPRVFYGATITLEEGVRVFRPLPPHKHVIVNPGNRTPLSLSFNEVVEKSYNYHYGEDRVGPFDGDLGHGGVGVAPFDNGFDDKKRRRPRVGPFNRFNRDGRKGSHGRD
jgi:hypothetical protein